MVVTPNGERESKNETKRIGIIRIQPELILDWLQFQGGRIVNVKMGFNEITIDFLIEHPDMPDVKEFDTIQEIYPSYQIDYLSKVITRLTPRR